MAMIALTVATWRPRSLIQSCQNASAKMNPHSAPTSTASAHTGAGTNGLREATGTVRRYPACRTPIVARRSAIAVRLSRTMGVPGERAKAGREGDVPELTAVVPVYGCRDCLETLHARLTAALDDLASSYEIVFVDDRSPDGAWEALREFAERDPHTVAIRLTRNFGQHAAITAGLEASRGDWVVVLDCDLQDP